MSEERDIDEALGFDWIEGKLEPIYEITPEIEMEIFAAGKSAQRGLRLLIKNLMDVRNNT